MTSEDLNHLRQLLDLLRMKGVCSFEGYGLSLELSLSVTEEEVTETFDDPTRDSLLQETAEQDEFLKRHPELARRS